MFNKKGIYLLTEPTLNRSLSKVCNILRPHLLFNTITRFPTNNIKELNYRYTCILFTFHSLMLDDQIETRVFLS